MTSTAGVLLDHLKAPYVPADFTPQGANALLVRTNDGVNGASPSLWQWSAGAWTRVGAPQYDRDYGQAGMLVPTPNGLTGTNASFGPTAGRCYYGRFVPSRNMGINLAAFVLITASASNDPVEIGIATSALGLIATTGVTTGKLNGTSGSVQTVNFASTVSLTAGTVYYIVYNTPTLTGAPVLEGLSYSGQQTADIFGATAGTRMIGYQSSVTTTIPSTGAFSNSSASMPLVAIRES